MCERALHRSERLHGLLSETFRRLSNHDMKFLYVPVEGHREESARRCGRGEREDESIEVPWIGFTRVPLLGRDAVREGSGIMKASKGHRRA